MCTAVYVAVHCRTHLEGDGLCVGVDTDMDGENCNSPYNGGGQLLKVVAP
jgi:hypothetical protein